MFASVTMPRPKTKNPIVIRLIPKSICALLLPQCSRFSKHNAKVIKVKGRETIQRKFSSKVSHNDPDSSNNDEHIDDFYVTDVEDANQNQRKTTKAKTMTYRLEIHLQTRLNYGMSPSAMSAFETIRNKWQRLGKRDWY